MSPAIRIVHEGGYVHRDISFRNILLQVHHDGTLRGLLIDYDYAVSIERASSTESVGERTGTLPFMAIGRLKEKPDFPHKYFHDLESMFYVLCWICTLYDGPRFKKRQFSASTLLYVKTAVAEWNGDVQGISNLRAIRTMKESSVSEGHFDETLGRFATYFTNIKECMWRLRDLFFNPTIGRPAQRIAFEKTSVDLDKRFKEATPEDQERIKRDFNTVPIYLRPDHFVLESFSVAFEETLQALPEEDTADDSVEDIKEDNGHANIGARRVRSFLEDVIPGAFADIDHEDTVDGAEDEGAGPSHDPFSTSMGGLTYSSSSQPNKRKSSEGSRSSSKRSKTLQTPGTSTSKTNVDAPKYIGRVQLMKPRVIQPKTRQGPYAPSNRGSRSLVITEVVEDSEVEAGPNVEIPN